MLSCVDMISLHSSLEIAAEYAGLKYTFATFLKHRTDNPSIVLNTEIWVPDFFLYAKLFWILTIGFRREGVLIFFYMYIREIDHASWRPCFSIDQICFSFNVFL